MMHISNMKKAALAFAAAGLMASASAHADSLLLDQDVNTLLAFTVDVSGLSKSVETGVFNVANQTTGGSFLAFCSELLQGVSVDAVTTGLEFSPSGAVPAAVQTLYNQSFSLVNPTSAVEVAGFQIALWEAMDDGDLFGGALQNWAGKTGSVTESEALDQAWIYLTALADGDPATASYKLTNWGNALSQDIIEAKIPEPTSMALGALGLAGLSLVRRRKS